MKVIHNDNVFIQMEDLNFLKEIDHNVPEFLINKSSEINNMSLLNHFDFIKINDQASIEYLNNTNIIIDYDEYRYLAYEEISGKLYRISRKINQLIGNFKSLNDDELHNAMLEYKILNHRFNSFKYLSDTLINRTEINIPEYNVCCK